MSTIAVALALIAVAAAIFLAGWAVGKLDQPQPEPLHEPRSSDPIISSQSFVQCEACEQGHAHTLCPSCRHNRDTIWGLEIKVADLKAELNAATKPKRRHA